MIEISFTVPGRPRPVGSYLFSTKFKRPIVLTSPSSRAWQLTARDQAAKAFSDRPPTNSPVELEVQFYFRRPKRHFKSGHVSPSQLKSDAPQWYPGPPDTDKLLRALLDAFTGVVYTDDRLVVKISATKEYGLYDKTDVVIRILAEE